MLKLLPLLLIPGLLFASTSPKCPGQKGYYYTNDKSKRNPRAGGFVAHSANVGDYVFIAQTAAVCDSASVLKFARVYGNAVVGGEAEVSEKARVYGDARVEGEAVVKGEAKVSGNAVIKGDAEIKGSAWVKGHKVISSGTYSSGKHSAKAPVGFVSRKQKVANQMNAKNKAERERQGRWKLESFQRDLKQGWFGTDRNKGFYRSFKYSKGDVKPPCAFYLNLSREQKTLDSHCRKTKRVRRKIWVPGKSDFETVKNCKTEYQSQGEKYFNFRKLRVSTYTDFANNRSYLDFNGYYFYVKGGNARKIREYADKMKKFAREFCGWKGK